MTMSMSLAEAKTRLAQEQAKLVAIKRERESMRLKQMRGELVEKSAVSKEWADMAGNVRKKILALETRIPARLLGVGPGEWSKVVHEEVYEVLSELSEIGSGGGAGVPTP